MEPILEETQNLVRQGAKQIDFSVARLAEFLVAATGHRFFTLQELEAFREACLRGEARAWGIPVIFHRDRL